MKPDPPIPNSAPPPVDIVNRGGGCAVGFLFICIGTITACALLGCKPVKPYVANASGESVAKSSAFIAAASANIDAAKPDSGKTGKTLLTVANSQLNNATKENDSASKQIHATQRELASAKSDLIREREHYIGYKLRVIIWWVVGLAAGAYLALGLLGAFLPFGGIGSTILRFLPFANPFAWLRDSVVHPKGKKGR